MITKQKFISIILTISSSICFGLPISQSKIWSKLVRSHKQTTLSPFAGQLYHAVRTSNELELRNVINDHKQLLIDNKLSHEDYRTIAQLAHRKNVTARAFDITGHISVLPVAIANLVTAHDLCTQWFSHKPMALGITAGATYLATKLYLNTIVDGLSAKSWAASRTHNTITKLEKFTTK